MATFLRYIGNTFFDASASAFLLNGTVPVIATRATDTRATTDNSAPSDSVLTANSSITTPLSDSSPHNRCACCARGPRGWTLFGSETTKLASECDAKVSLQQECVPKQQEVTTGKSESISGKRSKDSFRKAEKVKNKAMGSALGPFWLNGGGNRRFTRCNGLQYFSY